MKNKLLSLLPILLLVIVSRSCICASDGKWGINIHAPSDGKTLNRIAELGPEIVRVDFNWFSIEPEKRKFEWGAYDRLVGFCESHKIKILAVVAYPPEWASGKEGTNHMFQNTIDWEVFLWLVLVRYGKTIHSVEIWNEPNLTSFFTGTMEEYFDQTLVPASELIRLVNKDIKIVAPSVAVMTNRKWNKWLNKANEYSEYFDIVSFHIYRSTDFGVISKVEYLPFLKRMRIGSNKTVEKVIRKKFKGKKIWVTETGFERTTSKHSEIAQKDNIMGVIWGLTCIDRVFIYHLVDGKYDDDTYGILNRDLSTTKAFRYLRSFNPFWRDYADDEEKIQGYEEQEQ